MPFNIVLDELPAGYSISSVKKGNNATVITREFTSSEDGDLFISRLDGIPSHLINLAAKSVSNLNISFSVIDHLLAVINKDKTSTVYINEIPLQSIISLKKAGVNAGEIIYHDDIAEILRVKFGEIEIPNDSGILFLFSVGWRKGLFFDFNPLVREDFSSRGYDLEVLLGQYLSYLTFQDLFKISEEVWENIINQKWFPFISLKKATIEKIVFYASEEWNLDNLINLVSDDLTSHLPMAVKRWEANALFKEHFPFFKLAVERYLEKDYVSTGSILFPRIEGLLRTKHSTVNSSEKATQTNLVNSLVNALPDEQKSYNFLLPLKFQQYLSEVFFRNFDPNLTVEISRNSVSHGVAPFSEFNLKSATIALLIVDQLYFYLFADRK
jgi:hypothetical protein